MYRNALEKLKQWKNAENRQPLILQGARQVGKTWLMQEFGRLEFEHTAYINFEEDDRMHAVFENDLHPQRILQDLYTITGQTITPNTLLIFDEVQNCPRALTSLKYFCEDLPQQPVLAAGSLLGVALHPGTSFPVGKVGFLYVYPLTFLEFIRAVGNEHLYEFLLKCDFDSMRIVKHQCETLLKQYLYVGGMPAAVAEFAKTKNYQKVRDVQFELLDTYEKDFSKYVSNTTANRLYEVWHSVHTQLAKENKKFVYGAVREGARAKDYEQAIEWLQDSGLIYKLHRISKPNMPLSVYQDLNAFKIFMLDVGLLGALSKLSSQTILDGSNIFTEFKGALTEQYVLQQLKQNPHTSLYYWTSNSWPVSW